MQEHICYSKIPLALVACYQVNMNLNIRIRQLRKAKGLTIKQLAEIIGVSTPHLSEVERGKKNLNNHLLVRLAAALDAKPSELVEDDSLDEFQVLRDEVSSLPEEEREMVLRYAVALRQKREADELIQEQNAARQD